MSSEIGLLFYYVPYKNCLRQMQTKPMTEEESIKYVDAKILTHNTEEPDSMAAPPAYFVPLSAFKPIEATLAEPLKSEQFELREDDCDDPHCAIHNKSLQEELKQSAVGRAILRTMGVHVEEAE